MIFRFEKPVKLKTTTYPKLFIWIKIMVYSILIASYLFFGFILFKYTVSTFFTTVLFIILVGFLSWFIIKLVLKLFHLSPHTIKKLRNFWVLLFIMWFCIEVVLRISGINKTYNEQMGFYYSSGFNETVNNDVKNSFVWTNKPNENKIVKRKEFKYVLKCNSEGLRDIEHPVQKAEGEYRIICLGNSFTEGAGTPQDSTWPRLLKLRINAAYKDKITVFNAGCSGTDPFFEYFLLEKRLLKYKPDLVLLTLGASDLFFYRNRGGFERFTDDGLKYRKGPQWEIFYAMSFVVRFFTDNLLHYRYFLSPEDFKKHEEKALEDIYDCIYKFYKLAQDKHFKLVVVFYDDTDTQYSLLRTKLKDEKNIPVIDLFDYNKNIENISTEEWVQNYMWPIDKHFNSKGYNIMAKGVFWNLKNSDFFVPFKEKEN